MSILSLLGQILGMIFMLYLIFMMNHSVARSSIEFFSKKVKITKPRNAAIAGSATSFVINTSLVLLASWLIQEKIFVNAFEPFQDLVEIVVLSAIAINLVLNLIFSYCYGIAPNQGEIK